MLDLKNGVDEDPVETKEWLDAIKSVLKHEGSERAQYLINQVLDKLSLSGVSPKNAVNTPYVNTIPANAEPEYPGDRKIEKLLTSILRWNAIVTVLRAGKIDPSLGGHIATYASAAVLYEVGFHHFFHAATKDHPGDLIFIQGHSAPGIYARAYLEGRITEKQLDNFRQEIDKDGLSSYPHPWLMPEFWQFPTVSMGLGALQAIYQARFLKYLNNRGLCNTEKQKVWVFCGDGEMDEPESLGALSLGGREKLDNLIFVINCNLQRLDGPVRGNGKIIQELESVFRGAGWNVIKVLWAHNWDPLFAKDKSGLLIKRMMEVVDGEYQNYKTRDGAYVRENFFGKYPELKELVADMTDDEIWHLSRGGHDFHKVYTAYQAAVNHKGQPTVILAKTIKGYGMGEAGEAQNITHQQKKMEVKHLQEFCKRFHIPISDDQISKLAYYKPAADSPEMRYLQERRKELGGYLPARRPKSESLQVPPLEAFETILKGSDGREISTTMAFVRLLNVLLKDPNIGKRVVPIVPDESRTFGMEGLFRQIGIYSPNGQLYKPVDSDQVMYYREDQKGQFLQEGISEPGSMASWIAAATSYSTCNTPMIPFYVYYSMFGFQRIGDLAWAAGDAQARGFLVGGLAGRTSLPGEGLQHQDGQSFTISATIPNCISYDPTFGYELAVIIQDGLRRMYEKQENVYYYITALNENYVHPPMPEEKGVKEGIIKGMYRFRAAKNEKLTVQLLGSGAILREVIDAADILESEFNIGCDIWSVTSFTELRREALSIERENFLNPEGKPKESFVTQCLKQRNAPVVAATDYIRSFADQIRAYVPHAYFVLGTDGYGRSDTRDQLRYFFEVNRYFIALAALKSLADEGKIEKKQVSAAMKKWGISSKKTDPVTV